MLTQMIGLYASFGTNKNIAANRVHGMMVQR